MSVIHQPEASNQNTADLPRVDMKLEVVTLSVSDVERARRFYESLGWRLDADVQGEGFHVLQFTPPGSSSSVHVGKGISSSAPGSVQGLFLAVSDIEAARADVARRGVEISDVFHRAPGEVPGTGPHPTRRTYSSYAAFSDPDGNGWLLQEVTSRLPGRVDTDAVTFASRAELVAALWRAAVAHGEHEKRMGGQHDANWPDWYADHVFAERTGESLPT